MARIFWAAALAFATVRRSTSSATSASQSVQPAIPSQPALLPAVHWDHDQDDLKHLAPTDSHNLYYSAAGVSDPNIQHVFAQISTDLHYPAVILGHSSYVKAVQCQGRDLIVTFADKTAFDYAKTSWASVPSFVLVTYTAGCGSSTEQRTFWLIDHFEVGTCDTCITASVKKELAIEDVMHGVDLVWGTYSPSDDGRSRSRRDISSYGSSSTNSRSNSNSRSLMKRQDSTSVPGCGPAPSPRIDGFPTASCNSPTFDQDLDDTIGYLDFSEAQFDASLRAFAPGLDDYSSSGNQPARLRRNAGLVRRGFFSSIFDTIASAVSYVAKKVFTVENVVAVAVNVAKTVIPGYSVVAVVASQVEINQPLELQLPINIVPSGLVDSPWGPAK